MKHPRLHYPQINSLITAIRERKRHLAGVIRLYRGSNQLRPLAIQAAADLHDLAALQRTLTGAWSVQIRVLDSFETPPELDSRNDPHRTAPAMATLG